MTYSTKEIAKMMKVYAELEIEAKDFLFISSASLKNKEYVIRSAQKTIKAIEAYNKLPLEIRKELEMDKNMAAGKIIELEKLCKKTIDKK